MGTKTINVASFLQISSNSRQFLIEKNEREAALKSIRGDDVRRRWRRRRRLTLPHSVSILERLLDPSVSLLFELAGQM